MATYFAKFMGTIKELEINLTNLINELDNNAESYQATIQELTKNLDKLVSSENPDKAQLKHDFKNISQIYKKELEKPTKQLKTNLDKIQGQINLLTSKISESSSAESTKKPKFTTEEINELNKHIKTLTDKVVANQEKLRHLIDLTALLPIKLLSVQSKLELTEYAKEEQTFIAALDNFTNKLQQPEYREIANLEIIINKLQQLTTTATTPELSDSASGKTNKSILNLFANQTNGTAVAKEENTVNPNKIAAAKQSLNIS